MAERKDAAGRMPISREAVLTTIAPQVDRLIELGFHESEANRAYMRADDVALGGYSSVFEPRFRHQLQTILAPTFVENRSHLLLVVPTLRSDHQAAKLGLQGFSKWGIHTYQDEDLPQEPYVIEVKRGSLNQSPRMFALRSVGIVDSALSTDKLGSLESIRQGLQKKGQRGLNIYELLAYAREHPDAIDRIYGLKRMLIDKTGEQEYGERYFPTITQFGYTTQCERSDITEIPASMSEILFTHVDTQFRDSPNI